jgi:hypothetical protein
MWIHSVSLQTPIIASTTYCKGDLAKFDDSKVLYVGSLARTSILIFDFMFDIPGSNSRKMFRLFLAIFPLAVDRSKFEWVRDIRR